MQYYTDPAYSIPTTPLPTTIPPQSTTASPPYTTPHQSIISPLHTETPPLTTTSNGHTSDPVTTVLTADAPSENTVHTTNPTTTSLAKSKNMSVEFVFAAMLYSACTPYRLHMYIRTHTSYHTLIIYIPTYVCSSPVLEVVGIRYLKTV